jgi:IclR family KDG regulon transcriptional repressor
MTDQLLQSRAKIVQAAASRLSAEFGARDMNRDSAKSF